MSINIGIIGTGVSVRMLIPWFQKMGDVKIVGICGSSLDRTKEICEHNSLDVELITSDPKALCDLKTLDLICVTSPNNFHLEHAKLALATDKNVYLEKPVGNDFNETNEINNLIGDKNRFVVVGHELRFNPYFKKIKELVSSNKLGRIYRISINQRSSGLADEAMDWTWEFDEIGGGVRLAMGSHLIDLANYFLSNDPISISSKLDPVHKTKIKDGLEVNCKASKYFEALVNYDDSTAHIVTSASSYAEPIFDIEIYGENGDLTFSLKDGLKFYKSDGEVIILLEETLKDYSNRFSVDNNVFSASFSYFAQDILSAIENKTTNIKEAATVDSCLGYMKMLDIAKIESQYS